MRREEPYTERDEIIRDHEVSDNGTVVCCTVDRTTVGGWVFVFDIGKDGGAR